MAKKDTTDTAPLAPAVGSLNAFLDRGSAFEGKLTFQGAVRIDGKFTGDVMSDETLVLGDSGRIEGTATVGEADVSGTIKGTLTVFGTAHFRAGSLLEGELHTSQLVVDSGATINGTINMVLKDPETRVKEIKEEVEKTLF